MSATIHLADGTTITATFVNVCIMPGQSSFVSRHGLPPRFVFEDISAGCLLMRLWDAAARGESAYVKRGGRLVRVTHAA